MNTSFCSDNSRQAGEELIGTATNNQIYILVECPPPWAYDAFESKWVPENLKHLVQEVKAKKLPIKILLVANNLSHKKDTKTLVIYHQKKGLSNGYRKQEFLLPNIEFAAPVIKKWLSGGSSNYEIQTDITRDLLVCTHGSHDRCCSRYGNPFYFYALEIISNLGLDSVRIWKATHFGGHRFAPTMIDLPDGRYYGALQPETFHSVLTRTGDVACLNQIYRGWGILPRAIQVLERALILNYGWDWFNNKVASRILEESPSGNRILAELSFEKPDGSCYSYQALLVKARSTIVELQASCGDTKNKQLAKYAIASLCLISEKTVSCII